MTPEVLILKMLENSLDFFSAENIISCQQWGVPITFFFLIHIKPFPDILPSLLEKNDQADFI